MTKKQLLTMLDESILKHARESRDAYEKYCPRIMDLLHFLPNDIELGNIESIDSLPKYLERRDFSDAAAKLQIVVSELKTWIANYVPERKSEITAAKKTVFEFDGETFISIASIITAFILLVISIISCFNNGISICDSVFWDTQENGDTLSMLVTGMVMSIGGTFFLIKLCGKREIYHDAKKILSDAGVVVIYRSKSKNKYTDKSTRKVKGGGNDVDQSINKTINNYKK